MQSTKERLLSAINSVLPLEDYSETDYVLSENANQELKPKKSTSNASKNERD